jgi:hypothetical protein
MLNANGFSIQYMRLTGKAVYGIEVNKYLEINEKQ